MCVCACVNKGLRRNRSLLDRALPRPRRAYTPPLAITHKMQHFVSYANYPFHGARIYPANMALRLTLVSGLALIIIIIVLLFFLLLLLFLLFLLLFLFCLLLLVSPLVRITIGKMAAIPKNTWRREFKLFSPSKKSDFESLAKDDTVFSVFRTKYQAGSVCLSFHYREGPRSFCFSFSTAVPIV